MNHTNKKRGFTLIELLIVVVILGVLAAVGVPQYGKAVEKSKQAEAFQWLGYTRSAELRYYDLNDKFTTSTTELEITLPPDANPNYFAYSVTAADATSFTATAVRRDYKRSAGATTGYTVTIVRDGTIASQF